MIRLALTPLRLLADLLLGPEEPFEFTGTTTPGDDGS